MKNQLLFFYLLSFFLVNCNQAKKEDEDNIIQSDSLSYFFEMANNDSITLEKRKWYTKKAVIVISKKNNDSLRRVNYFKVANRYYNMNEMEDYKKTSFLLIKNSIEARDTISLLKSYGYVSDYYISKNISDSAYIYNFELQKLYTLLKDDVNVAKCLLNKAILQHNEGDFLGCERTVFTALKRLRTTNNYEMRYEAYNYLGIVYAELAEYKLSKEYYERALQIVDMGRIPIEYQLKATTLNNLGILYRNQNNDKESLKYFKRAIDEKNLFEDMPNIYAMVKDNLAYSEFKLGNHKNLPELFFEALKVRDSLNIIPGIIINNIHLSEFYASKNDTLKAIQHGLQAYVVAKDNNEVRDVLLALKQLSNVEPKKALQYSAEYYKINDSLQLAERRIKNKFSRIEYETEELVLEKEKLVEQRKTLIYIGLGMMLHQQDKIEEVRQLEKKRIAQDLHDGILGKLFGTRLSLGKLNTENTKAAEESRNNYIEELKTIEQEIREISHDLNSEKTAIFNNFVLMVANFIENQRTVCKAKVNFSMDPLIDWNGIDNMAKINFYRILQEAFQNINKYAEAQNVFVTFAQNNSKVELKVQDDGTGFNYLKKKKGIGLSNMETRIKSSGGTMKVMAEIGEGALLIFELPV